MKLDIKAAALTGAVVWGGLALFLTGLANLIWPGYGQAFLDVAASLYPGYNATASFAQVIIGTVYGALDGAVAGAVLAVLTWPCLRRLFFAPRAGERTGAGPRSRTDRRARWT